MDELQQGMDSATAAEVLCVRRQTLSNWRHRGEGPSYKKFGRRVVYFPADIQAYIEANAIDPTGKGE